MKIVIAGGTGFLGGRLSAALAGQGHDVVVFGRHAGSRVPAGVRLVTWDPEAADAPWTTEISGSGAVVNLAGEPIGDHRWTAARKHSIEESRVNSTRRIVAAIREAAAPPPVLVNQSAVGFYGACGDEVVTEETGAGHDFLAGVARRWEAQAVAACSSSTRVVCLRTGLVLGHDGGALPRMLPPFRFGVGGPIGSGRQYWPWIHWADWVALVRFVLETSEAVGPINATAPNPVTNREFARELGRTMGRPAALPVPGFALKILLGEMAGPLLLSGQRAIPARARQLGFRFSYPMLSHALDAVLHHEQ